MDDKRLIDILEERIRKPGGIKTIEVTKKDENTTYYKCNLKHPQKSFKGYTVKYIIVCMDKKGEMWIVPN